MLFDFLRKRSQKIPDKILLPGGKQILISFRRNRLARRYVLRLRPDGSARVTIPSGGSEIIALNFVGRNRFWLEQQWQRLATRTVQQVPWQRGTDILFRGNLVKVTMPENNVVQLGCERIQTAIAAGDLRPAIEKHLWQLAVEELPPLVFEFAILHQVTVNRVTVRNQKSRWGSCSRRGTISLNWRLIQAPPQVRDYIVLHELMHLRQMNHSSRFWREVERVCPDYQAAERWLKQHASLLK